MPTEQNAWCGDFERTSRMKFLRFLLPIILLLVGMVVTVGFEERPGHSRDLPDAQLDQDDGGSSAVEATPGPSEQPTEPLSSRGPFALIGQLLTRRHLVPDGRQFWGERSAR